MINSKRGESQICINGENHKLCLTLGALAQLEDTLGQGDLSKLQERLKNPKVSDIVLILHALLGGGGSRLTLEALKASDVDLGMVAKAISDSFTILNREDH